MEFDKVFKAEKVHGVVINYKGVLKKLELV